MLENDIITENAFIKENSIVKEDAFIKEDDFVTENSNILLITQEIIDTNTIPTLLEDKDILSKLEEGTNSLSNKNKKPIEKLSNYINLKNINDNNYDYDSEDENLLHLMDNIKIKIEYMIWIY